MRVGLHVHDDKSADLQIGKGMAKIQLATNKGTRLVGVGPDTLSIHMLRPYQDPSEPGEGGWEEFELRIEKALEAYRKTVEPISVNQVGVRYINKIEIPSASAKVEEYLKCANLEVEGLPENYTNFVSRVEYLFDKYTRLVLSLGLLGTSQNSINLLLDLDVIWRKDDVPVKWAEVSQIPNELHRQVESAFEAIVTEKAKELFDAV